MYEVQLEAVGSYAPEKVVTNDDLSQIVDTSDEWIHTRTGIRERRISDENTSDIAVKAAKDIIQNYKINPEEIDLILVATTSTDKIIPSIACIVQDKIGAHGAACFDINSACSGFIYGMIVAEQFIKTGQSKKALVIGAEVLSKIVDWKDRNTCVLFGDGAGAAVVTRGEKPGIIKSYMCSDGTKGSSLTCDKNTYVKMNGKEIFKFATLVMEKTVKKLLEDSNLTLDNIKCIIPHQANYRIIEHTAKKLKVDINKFYINLQNYGNTSAASIPIALCEAVKSGRVSKGDKILLVGFGGGLTWGGLILQL